LKRVFLFGSRVRGNDRDDSDLDLGIDLTFLVPTSDAVEWWLRMNRTGFADLQALLPMRLEVHRSDDPGEEWPAIRKAAREPVLVVGKCVCVRTPPKA
jgi:predicted nucleotidyltransferase